MTERIGTEFWFAVSFLLHPRLGVRPTKLHNSIDWKSEVRRDRKDATIVWVLHDFEWGEAFLDSFLNGAGTGQPWPELAQARLGGGDLSILVEAEMYRARLGIDYEIWTYDDGLRSYAPALTL